jgi:hypothetical protein
MDTLIRQHLNTQINNLKLNPQINSSKFKSKISPFKSHSHYKICHQYIHFRPFNQFGQKNLTPTSFEFWPFFSLSCYNPSYTSFSSSYKRGDSFTYLLQILFKTKIFFCKLWNLCDWQYDYPLICLSGFLCKFDGRTSGFLVICWFYF